MKIISISFIINLVVLNLSLASDGGLDILNNIQQIHMPSCQSHNMKVQWEASDPAKNFIKKKQLGPIYIKGFNIAEVLHFTPDEIFFNEASFFYQIYQALINHPENAIQAWNNLPHAILPYLNLVRFFKDSNDVLIGHGYPPLWRLNRDLLQGKPVIIHIVRHRRLIGPLQESGIF